MKKHSKKKEIVQKKDELVRLIKLTEHYKKDVRKKVKDISDQYQRGTITLEVYKAKIKSLFGDKKPTAILEKYDTQLKQYRTSLRKEQRDLSKVTVKSQIIVTAFILLLLTGGIFLLQPFLTGFLALGNTVQTTPVQVIANTDQTYTFTPPTRGELTSLAVSGSIVGEGDVQIYLEDETYLIYDSAHTTQNRGFFSFLTGFITALGGRTSPLNVVDEVNQTLPAIVTLADTVTEVIPTISYLERIALENLQGSLLGISNVARGIVEPPNVTFAKIYSLDTTALTFTTGTVTATAEGNALYTCSFWDFSLSLCLGSWDLVKQLIEGQSYDVAIASQSTVAFAEATLNSNTTPQQPPSFPLTLLDIAVTNFTLGDVATFDTLVKHEGIEALSAASVQLLLFDKRNTILANLTSEVVPLTPSKLHSFVTYWDTARVSPGTYSGRLLLFAEDTVAERIIRVRVTSKAIVTDIVSITGNVVGGSISKSKKNNFFQTTCIDTCTLHGFNKTAYTLLIRVTNAVLNLTNIDYTFTHEENASSTVVPPSNQKPHNKTLQKIKGNRLHINKTFVTYEDTKVKSHKLQREKEDKKKEAGKNWERDCNGNKCAHVLYQHNKYHETVNETMELITNAITEKGCRADEEVCIKGKHKRIGFRQKASDDDTVTVLYYENALTLTPLQLRHVAEDVQTIISSANPVTGEGVDNTYSYQNVFGPSTELKFTYQGDYIKETITFTDASILSDNNLSNATGYFSLDYLVTRSTTLDWHANSLKLEALAPNESIATNSSLELKNSTGESIFALPQPFVQVDLDSEFLPMVLTNVNDQEIISVHVPLSHFQEGIYPLIIDPGIRLGAGESIFDGYTQAFPKFGEFTRQSSAATLEVGDETDVGACQATASNVCHHRISLEWDISSIPDNADVYNVNLSLRLLGDSGAGSPDTTLFFFHMDGNNTVHPNTNPTGNRHFHLDIENGTNYLNSTQSAGSFRDYNLSESPDFLADLHLQLQKEFDYFAIGIRSNETNNTGATPQLISSADHETAAFRPSMTLHYDLPPPSILLEAPANDSVFAELVNITLNATVFDNEPTIKDVVFYGSDGFPPRTEDIIALFPDASNGTKLQYNWTAPVQKADDNTILLLHFDNRSEFGENRTHVVDFSNESINGTIVGETFSCIKFNASAAKLGGTFSFGKGNIDCGDFTTTQRNITFGDQDNLIGLDRTYMMWLKSTNVSTNGTILSKYVTDTGFFIQSVKGTDDAPLLVKADSTRLLINNYLQLNVYVHLAITINASGSTVIYKDGVNISAPTIVSITGNDADFILGLETDDQEDSYQGTIDELSIHNRTLTAEEIEDAYRLRGGVYYWHVNATDDSPHINGSNMSEIRMFTIADKPVITFANLTPSPANTTDTLECNFTVIFDDSDASVTANVTFYNGSTIFESTTLSVSNGTVSTQPLTAGAQAKGETWICSVFATNAFVDGDSLNSSNVSVLNSVPGTPTLAGPPENFVTNDLTPGFNWTSVTDADNDTVHYVVNITCFSTAGGSCTAPGDNRLFNVSTNSTDPGSDLKFKIDDGFHYNWTIRSSDNENESAYAATRTFNITVLVAINLAVDSIDFQTLGLGKTNDTSATEVDPDPFRLSNNGNSFIEVNLSALSTDADLFDSVSVPSSHYQFKGSNIDPLPLGSGQTFNSSRSITTYTNVDSENQTVFGGFNYTKIVEIDINVTVPFDEPSGSKGATLLVEGYYIGGDT